MKITTIEMEVALSEHFDPRRNIIVPNVSWGATLAGMGLHECDLLVLTKSGCAWEVEIKISKADLVKDKAKKHGHKSGQIKRLYFAIPEHLSECTDLIPERAGIIIVYRREWGLECRQFRAARENGKYRLTVDETLNISRLGAMRIWTLKKKIIALTGRSDQ